MRKLYQLILFCFFLIFCFCEIKAQQYPFFQQYLYQPFLYNPAATGLGESSSISLMNRQQWLGFEGRPITYGLAMQFPLGKGPFAIGAHINNDQNYVFGRTALQVAPTIHLGNELNTLSVGFNIGVINHSIDYTRTLEGITNVNSLMDPIFQSGMQLNSWVLDAGIGLHYQYENEATRFRFGLSTSQLPNNPDVPTDGVYTFGTYTHLFLNTSFRFPLSDQLNLEPIILYRNVLGNINIGTPSTEKGVGMGGGEADLFFKFSIPNSNNVNFGLGARLNAGQRPELIDISDRTLESITGLFGLDVSDKLNLNIMAGFHTFQPLSLEAGLTYKIAQPEPEDLCKPIYMNPPCMEDPVKTLGGGLSTASVLPIIRIEDVIITYTFEDDDDLYDLQVWADARRLLFEIIKDAKEIQQYQDSDRLGDITKIRLIADHKDPKGRFNLRSLEDYTGSAGTSLSGSYLLDGESNTYDIQKANRLLRGQLSIVKLLSMQNQIQGSLNLKSDIFSLELNSGLNIPTSRRYRIELTFEKIN